MPHGLMPDDVGVHARQSHARASPARGLSAQIIVDRTLTSVAGFEIIEFLKLFSVAVCLSAGRIV